MNAIRPRRQPVTPIRGNKDRKSGTSRSGASVSSLAERPYRRTQTVAQPSRLAGGISVTPSATWTTVPGSAARRRSASSKIAGRGL
jgi:hypothetical protein